MNDSEAKIAAGLQDHHRRLILVACLSILYARAAIIVTAGVLAAWVPTGRDLAGSARAA